MKKSRQYPEVIFDALAVRLLLESVRKDIGTPPKEHSIYSLREGRDQTGYANLTQLLAAMRRPFDRVYIWEAHPECAISIEIVPEAKISLIEIEHTDEDLLLRHLELMTDHEARCRYVPPRPIVFIGHGRETTWLELQNYLQNQQHLVVQSYEVEPRGGRATSEVVQDMIHASSFGVLVLCPEVEWADGSKHARENVIHELGWSRGVFGAQKTVALVEEGTTVFSNEIGVTYIKFNKRNISQTYGELIALIRREFPDAFAKLT